MTRLENPEAVLRYMEEQIPFNRHLGIRGESVARGRCVLRLAVRPEMTGDAQRPALHGGVLATLLDTAGGLAAWSALEPDEMVSTVDLTVDFLEPATPVGVDLRCEAELIRKGNRVCHTRMRVVQGDKLVAEGRGVFNIHRKRDRA